MLSRAAPRSIPRNFRALSTRSTIPGQNATQSRVATASYQSRAQRKQQQLFRSLFAVALVGGAATLSQFYVNNGQLLRSSHAEAPPAEEENPLIFEKSRKKKGVSVEENRDLISSQHHQVKRSLENPGVYAWGNNSGGVVAPDSKDSVVKTPRRIPFFDGKLLRDIKLDRTFGAAIDEQGNLLQWGTGYAPDIKEPVTTLQGKNLVSLVLSRDRILGLSSSGKVYSVPVSAADQASGTKPTESSWIPFMSSQSQIAYRDVSPADLGSGEKISSLAGGLEHAILLTSKGRLYSAASASDSYPARGQLGVPGLTWQTRPEGDFDQPHPVTTLKGFEVSRIACGDFHSVALDKEGRIFTWGDNASGQLGFENSAESSIVDAPSLVSLQKLYSGTSQLPRITSIAAGGSNTYFTVDATKVAPRAGSADASSQSALLQVGKVTADVFALGSGIYGNLGNSRWTHVQSTPTKIPALSGLFEYDEQTNTTVPIRLGDLNVGATHAAAVLKNITYLGATDKTSTDDTNWGADIVFWGNNEFYQLGTGKRNNSSNPIYIQPLDMAAEVARAKRSTGAKEEHRFHITPRTKTKLPDGRTVEVEQKVECGRGVTCVYSSA